MNKLVLRFTITSLHINFIQFSHTRNSVFIMQRSRQEQTRPDQGQTDLLYQDNLLDSPLANLAYRRLMTGFVYQSATKDKRDGATCKWLNHTINTATV